MDLALVPPFFSFFFLLSGSFNFSNEIVGLSSNMYFPICVSFVATSMVLSIVLFNLDLCRNVFKAKKEEEGDKYDKVFLWPQQIPWDSIRMRLDKSCNIL